MNKLELVNGQLLFHLKRLSRETVEIQWIAAFAMKSGVNRITPFLKQVRERGVLIKIPDS